LIFPDIPELVVVARMKLWLCEVIAYAVPSRRARCNVSYRVGRLVACEVMLPFAADGFRPDPSFILHESHERPQWPNSRYGSTIQKRRRRLSLINTCPEGLSKRYLTLYTTAESIHHKSSSREDRRASQTPSVLCVRLPYLACLPHLDVSHALRAS
jgi:hypothetical protein